MKTTPYWWEAAEPEHGEQTMNIEHCDVLIIGSGYTGLSAAITLAKGGVAKIVVIDELRIGEGASSRNGGLYGTQPKFKFDFAERKFGKKRAIEIFDDYEKSTEFMLKRAKSLNDDFDLQANGNIKSAHSVKDFREMKRFYENLPQEKKSNFTLYNKNQIKEVLNTNIYQGALVSHELGGIHPAKYVRALADKAQALGVRIFTGWSYKHAKKNNNKYLVTVQQVNSNKQTQLKTEKLLIAVNGYTGSEFPWLKKRTIPMQSYMIATEELPYDRLEALIPKNRVVSDTKRILYYFRRSPSGKRILFGGRARFRTSTAEQAAVGLRRFMLHVFPSLIDAKISHSWFGNVCFAFDLISHAGRKTDGIYYSSCCNGSGISMATYLGHRIAETMLNKQGSDDGIINLPFPAMPFYDGNPWFLPIVGTWYRFLDQATLRLSR